MVKSHPELWTECSDAESLARHLDGFGEIRITRLEPETAVAWEGERASGTVRLEPSGWGTRVVMTATPAPTAESEVVVEQFARPEPRLPAAEPAAPGETPPGPEASRPGLFARLLGRWRPPPSADLPPPQAPSPVSPPVAAEPVAEPALELAEPAADPMNPEAALSAALESLGKAHHRPYSRG